MQESKRSVARAIQGLSPDRRLTLFLSILSLFLVAVMAFILLGYQPADDVVNFFNQAMYMRDGQLPYTDFEFEFPPFALLFFYIPGLFATDLATYTWIFAFECLVLQIAALWCVARIVPGGSGRYVACLVFAALMIAYMPESFKKFDGIVMSLSVISLYFFTRQRWALSYGIMGVATLTKLYPGFFILLMVAYNLLSSRGGVRAVARGAGACVAVLALAFLPLLAAGVDSEDILSFLGFHDSRGFHVESFPAAIIQLLGLLGLTEVGITPSHYTYDITGALPDAIAWVWTVASMAAVLLVLVYCVYLMSMGRTSTRDLVLSMFVVVVSFVLLNKVFSTQYTMWLFPFIAILCGVSGKLPVLVRAFMVMAVVMEVFSLSILCFDVGSAGYVTVCLIRDLILVAMALMAAKGLRDGWPYGGDVTPVPAAGPS
ncbi:MAG: glycosyltransferase family 87 protein [Thermoplasmata archaeon]|nr:glycosyltransferase family 87 protein [Thermoplasmata archaeon]